MKKICITLFEFFLNEETLEYQMYIIHGHITVYNVWIMQESYLLRCTLYIYCQHPSRFRTSKQLDYWTAGLLNLFSPSNNWTITTCPARLNYSSRIYHYLDRGPLVSFWFDRNCSVSVSPSRLHQTIRPISTISLSEGRKCSN